MAGVKRVTRTRRGDFDLRLPKAEREVLRVLPAQLRELLGSDDPALGRLFPPAYEDDPDRTAEYDQLVRNDLLAGRLKSLEVMEATVDARRLTEDQIVAWLGALNDLRLTLGTKLEVTEDLDAEGVSEDHPQAHLFALYFYLGWLQEQIVEALASSVDPGGTEPESSDDL